MNVNQAVLTPAVASQLEPQDVPTLEMLIVGGEAMPRKLIEDWADRVPFFNIYGPSECSIYCTGKADITRTTEPSNIGWGVGAMVWVADQYDYNKLVPIGSVGELLIDGPGVARGYLGNEAQTQAAFVNPIWATIPGSTTPRRLYRTGDLVYYNPDGSIAIVGRNDGQIKLHGQRIEIGEVEHQLKKSLLGSVDAAVCVVTPEGGRSSLVAFVASGVDKNKTMEPKIVRSKAGLRSLQAVLDGVQDKMRSALPSYMVPETFIPVSSLPLSSSGKIDRKGLQAMASGLSSEELFTFRGAKVTQCQRLLPSTPMEKALQTFWKELLQLSDVGLDDDFFHLGGDSVIAMRLAAHAKKQGVAITVPQIFRKPVLADLALVAAHREIQQVC
jgi:acyl-CoA synthetase (AMP-forming)/AMP-acid ligase II/aryl carrier-like protein